jgi:hypothetical protein
MADFKICTICHDSNLMNGLKFIRDKLSNKMKLGFNVCTKCYQNHLDDIQYKKDYLNRKIDLDTLNNVEDDNY